METVYLSWTELFEVELIICLKMDLALNNLQITNQLRGSLNKFPDFFRMGTFIDSTHMKL